MDDRGHPILQWSGRISLHFDHDTDPSSCKALRYLQLVPRVYYNMIPAVLQWIFSVQEIFFPIACIPMADVIG